MPLPTTKLNARVLGGPAFAALLSLATPPSLAQGAASPFLALAGTWSGGGTIATSSGANERVHCRATYSVVTPDGHDLRQELRCASDAYRFEVTSSVVYQNGRIGGTWTEKTRNATGHVSGTASGDEIRTTVEGPGFSASLLLVTHGNRQTVLIRPEGVDVTSVSLELRRG